MYENEDERLRTFERGRDHAVNWSLWKCRKCGKTVQKGRDTTKLRCPKCDFWMHWEPVISEVA